jgi:hypothetical protein
MFNWVELDQPPASDARALLAPALGGLLILGVIAGFALWFFA